MVVQKLIYTKRMNIVIVKEGKLSLLIEYYKIKKEL